MRIEQDPSEHFEGVHPVVVHCEHHNDWGYVHGGTGAARFEVDGDDLIIYPLIDQHDVALGAFRLVIRSGHIRVQIQSFHGDWILLDDQREPQLGG